MTRRLLTCGLVAGPVYIVVAVAQVLLREGFDITRHAVSLLSLGDLGWIQITNFIVTGLLVVAFALGLRRVLENGRGSTWGPVLIAVFGVGLGASGVFVADPMDGFPPGTPPGDPVVVSWHGIMHFVTGGVSFMGLIAACFVFARRFSRLGDAGWATYSAVTGAFYFVSFALIAVFPGQAATNLLLTLAVILGFVWIAALSVRHLSMSESPARVRSGIAS